MKIWIVLLLVAAVAAEQKREAEPSGYGYETRLYRPTLHHGAYNPYGRGLRQPYRGSGVARHPYGGISYVGPTVHRGRREAEPGYTPYPHYVRTPGRVYGYETQVQHPGYGYSYQRQHRVQYPGYYRLY
ncbi:uncharacterized protein LOC122256445 [Penaeus japonicus]|uniref:uncharacterized protein LOC122256445 n=1 Tax=Penaeus japonicus TaxID=27405 RepID=UPI001C70C517|nr:uncharacterized protein LOC122256445 [Penaeus japonicus]